MMPYRMWNKKQRPAEHVGIAQKEAKDGLT